MKKNVFFLILNLSLSALAGEHLPEPLGTEQLRQIIDDVGMDPHQEEALRFIFQLEPYEPERFSGLMHSDFYVVAGNKEIADACLAILDNDRFQSYWQETLHSLGVMASVDASRVDFERLTDRLAEVENSDLPTDVIMKTLRFGYIAVARFGMDKSEEFLVPRMKAAFWEGKHRLEQDWAPAGQPPNIVTPRDFAIRSFSALGDEEAGARLRSLLSNELEQRDEAVEFGIEVVEGVAELQRRSHERRLQLYREWQEKHPESQEEADFPDDESAFGREYPEETEGLDAPDESRDPGSEEAGEALRHPWLYGVVVAFVGVLGVILLWCVAKIRSG
jgi:hypothetical protein